jgi:hypothetical protein
MGQSPKETPKIIYLSDTDYVYEMLENRQRAIYENDKFSTQWKNSKEEIELLIEIAKKYHIKKKDVLDKLQSLTLSTRYEHPVSFSILKDNIYTVEEQLKKNGIGFKAPKYGTLPTTKLNASTNITFPESPLIIVNSGVFNFCHELLKIAFKTIEFSADKHQVSITYSDEILDDLIAHDQDLIVKFSRALEDYANNRVIKSQYTADTLQANLEIGLVSCMEIFILAHEYGHMILGHKSIENEDLEVRSGNRNTEKSLNIVLNSWQQEIEADFFGIIILDSYLQSNPSEFDSLLKFAPYIYFSLAEIAEESAFILKNKRLPDTIPQATKDQYFDNLSEVTDRSFLKATKEAKTNSFHYKSTSKTPLDTTLTLSKSHPPSWLRRNIMKRFIDQNKITNEDTFETLALAFSRNLILLWEKIRIPWVKILNKNVKIQTPKVNQED